MGAPDGDPSMRRRPAAPSILAAAALVAGPGCSHTSPPADAGTPDVVVDGASIGGPVTLDRGQALVVRLRGNATTGYAWTCTDAGTGVVSVVGEPAYVPDDAGEGVVGAGGTAVFRFAAAGAGSCELRFAYVRPWEKGVAPARTAGVAVTVR
jgi:inhibitor of cysteine peptidase